MTRLAIIDYGSGNLRSVAKAFEHVGASVTITSAPEILQDASHIVLPGVGAFADCMAGLKALPGMLDALEREVRTHKKQFLGICVGMQMLFERGHEHGTHAGLAWLKGEVVPLVPNGLKIPHMGWNELEIASAHPLLHDIKTGDHVYFVHSYHATSVPQECMLAEVQYGQKIVAVVGKNNIMGTQFHPEKSQEMGLKILANFMEIR